MNALPKRKMTLEEYFEFDKNAEGNFEYFNGEIFELSGVSVNHARIERNLSNMLTESAFRRGCEVLPSGVRIKVPSLPTYRYPDLSVTCGKIEVEMVGGLECVKNPNVLVEILSDSTAQYDVGKKFEEYKSISSFVEYVTIAQTDANISIYQKHEGRFWLFSSYTTGETLYLKTLDFELNVDDVYRNVEFPPEEQMLERR